MEALTVRKIRYVLMKKPGPVWYLRNGRHRVHVLRAASNRRGFRVLGRQEALARGPQRRRHVQHISSRVGLGAALMRPADVFGVNAHETAQRHRSARLPLGLEIHPGNAHMVCWNGA